MRRGTGDRVVEHIDVEGLRVAYLRAGAGPTVVLLHGGLSDSREWRPQVEALTDSYSVLAWDAPGCGQSDDPPERFRLEDYADCLATWLARLDVTRAHVVGLSFGSGLALELFRRHRPLVRTLVLASAYAGWRGSLRPDEVQTRLAQVLAATEGPPEQLVADALPTLVTDSAPADLSRTLSALMLGFHPAGARTMARAFAEADLRPVLPTVDVPTLLIHGARDRRSPLTVAHHLHASIPRSELVLLEGVGHQCNLEAPGPFNDELTRFLDRATAWLP